MLKNIDMEDMTRSKFELTEKKTTISEVKNILDLINGRNDVE